MNTIYQSCGMLLKHAPKGKTNPDATSKEYCSYCYENGAFINQKITVEEMRGTVH